MNEMLRYVLKPAKMVWAIIQAVSVAICLALPLLFLYTIYNEHWSPEARQGHLNQQHSKSIRQGMSRAEVKAIMGEPMDSSRDERVPQTLAYYYRVPPGSSLSCRIIFDFEARVTKVYCPSE
ncbi:hypothetical protein GCM10023186_02040 [Hymenobacter koreensis]|uniref:Outer membrane protein assembly factor BamE domain-containing protein n=2 Tax=Hymenobacter koreensis TaxID=1084523 RepID=A0ABP8ITN1_9BACT